MNKKGTDVVGVRAAFLFVLCASPTSVLREEISSGTSAWQGTQGHTG